jgi:hypothetical protein
MDRFLVPGAAAYLLGDLATLVWLLVEDLPAPGLLSGLRVVAVDALLAHVWPAYWLLLRWVA